MLHSTETIEAWLCEHRRSPLVLLTLGAVVVIDLGVTVLALACQ